MFTRLGDGDMKINLKKPYSSLRFLLTSLNSHLAKAYIIGSDAIFGGPEALCFIVGGVPVPQDPKRKL